MPIAYSHPKFLRWEVGLLSTFEVLAAGADAEPSPLDEVLASPSSAVEAANCVSGAPSNAAVFRLPSFVAPRPWAEARKELAAAQDEDRGLDNSGDEDQDINDSDDEFSPEAVELARLENELEVVKKGAEIVVRNGGHWFCCTQLLSPLPRGL